MAIDRIPAVGRIVLRESIYLGGFCMGGGRIVKVTPKGVTYQDRRWPEKTISVRRIAAVCDTEEEEAMLLAFENRCMEERGKLGNAQRMAFAEFFR